MNILYITNHLNTGGITSYVYTLARGMRQRGHGVYIASSGGELLERFQREGATFIPIPIKTKNEVSPRIIISALKLSGIIKDRNIDLVHSNSRTTQVLGCLLGKLTDKPHISTCHGFFKTRLLRRLFPCWGQAVVAISEAVKEHLAFDFRINEEKIFIIHNGIDVERFQTPNPKSKNEIKKEYGLHDGPVVGIVARLSDVKGHYFLIEAMSNVLKKNPQAQLLIVGEGKMQRQLIVLVNELGMKESVFFIPKVTDTKEVLSITDIFVMPSLKEGLGLALMEAMACGLAVIGSDVGGIKSLISHGVNGLLVRPKDPKGLEESIAGLLADEEKRKSLGRNARDYIISNFSEDKMILETEKLYARCLSAGEKK